MKLINYHPFRPVQPIKVFTGERGCDPFTCTSGFASFKTLATHFSTRAIRIAPGVCRPCLQLLTSEVPGHRVWGRGLRLTLTRDGVQLDPMMPSLAGPTGRALPDVAEMWVASSVPAVSHLAAVVCENCAQGSKLRHGDAHSPKVMVEFPGPTAPPRPMPPRVRPG